MQTKGDSLLERSLQRRARRRRAFRRILLRTVAYLAVIVLFTVFYLSIIGVPEPVAKRILDEVNKGQLYLQVEKLKLDPFEGIVAVSPRLFRKKVIGAPFMQAAQQPAVRGLFGDVAHRFIGRFRRGLVVNREQDSRHDLDDE